jgi:hypothetical protein
LLLLSAACGFGAPSVRLADLPGRAEPAPLLPAVFGNRTQALDLEIDNAAPSSGDLVADLFQTSGELALPLTKGVHVQDAITLDGNGPQRLHVSLKFSNVQQRAEILVRFSLVPHASNPMPVQVGELHFEVFPASITKELADLLKPRTDGTIPAVLFGAGRKLQNFLAQSKIPYDVGGMDLPDQFEPHRIYFGEAAHEESYSITQEIRQRVHMAVFAPDPSVPAGIYAEQAPDAVFIRVTLPLLDNLNDDPRAQLGLIKIIQLLTAPSSSINPSVNL